MKNIKSLLFTLLILPITILITAFQSTEQIPPTINITQIDTSDFPNITLYISAIDIEGNPIAIDPSMLEISENGTLIAPGEIKGLGQVGPLTTLLVTDASGSMNNAGKLDSAKAAATLYINQMRENDQTGLVIFNTEYSIIQPLTKNKNQLISAINSISAKNDTAMYDALLSSIDTLNKIKGRTAIILLTDGLDNASISSLENVISQIGPSGITISSIGLGEAGQGSGDISALDEESLMQLASQTGGIYSYSEDADRLDSLYQQYATALQSEYVITYVSPAAYYDGNNRSITISYKDGVEGDIANNISSEKSIYNPGGLLPETEQVLSWELFNPLLIFLIILLILPSVIQILKRGKKKSGIKLK